MNKFEQLNNNKAWCSLAWTHQFLDSTGRIKPCCRFTEKFRPKVNNLNSQEFLDIFYGDWMNEVRGKMLRGEKIPGCQRCYEEQESGKKTSLREIYNKNFDLPVDKLVNFKKPKIRWLELAISNDCNLACRMCDSRYAYKWFDDELELYGKAINPKKYTKIDVNLLDPFLKDLVHIKFTGGEPLITPGHYELMEKLIKHGYAQNIFLNYSTNCTIEPNRKLLEHWRYFKWVEFALSFDAIGAAAEYIRYPAAWPQIEETTRKFFQLHKYFKNKVGLRTTVSLLNIYELPEMFTWWIENYNRYYFTKINNKSWINPTHLTYPKFLSITVLPKKYKEKVIKKLEFYSAKGKIKDSVKYLIEYMNSADNSHLLKELEYYITKLDKLRNQNFYQVYPHYKGLFNYT